MFGFPSRLFPATLFPGGHIFPKENARGRLFPKRGPFISQSGRSFPNAKADGPFISQVINEQMGAVISQETVYFPRGLLFPK